jgi:hypothetical protein
MLSLFERAIVKKPKINPLFGLIDIGRRHENIRDVGLNMLHGIRRMGIGLSFLQEFN